MASKSKKLTVSTPLGIHELELALIRELAAWRDWDLDNAAIELSLMKRICKKTDWMDDYLPLVDDLGTKIKYAALTVKNKDTTLIGAAHTRLERAIFDLRDKLYK